MKLSKMRAKARFRFSRGRVDGYRWDVDGQVHPFRPQHQREACTSVVVIRGRAFTAPQTARQYDR